MVDTIRPDADIIPSGRWQQGGIMIRADVAELILPYRAVKYGEYGIHLVSEDNCDKQALATEQEFLQFGNDGTQLIPLYELLSTHYITDYEIIRRYGEQELLNAGRFQLPEYFGELIFPLSLYLRCQKHRRLDNGIWVFRRKEGAGLCVHDTVSANAMSLAALTFGTTVGNSTVFWESAAAIAFLELADSFGSINALIPEAERASLKKIIQTQYPLYLFDEMPGGKGVVY